MSVPSEPAEAAPPASLVPPTTITASTLTRPHSYHPSTVQISSPNNPPDEGDNANAPISPRRRTLMSLSDVADSASTPTKQLDPLSFFTTDSSPGSGPGPKFTIITNVGTPKSQALLSTTMEVLDSPTSTPDTSPWIGGHGLGNTGLGKSGRVIERLMAENDRLRREMKAEITKREELARAVATAKPKVEKLETENARLMNVKGMDDAVIKRRERKIEELKAELESERTRREDAEKRAADSEKEKDEVVEALRKDLAVTREEARHSNVHAEILQTSHAQLAKEYRQRVAGLHKSLRDLEGQKEEDRKRLARLDVVGGQMRGEVERMRRMHAELLNVWHKFETTKNLEVEGMEEGARKLSVGIDEKEKEKVKLAEDMVEVMGKMKWVLNLDSLQRGAHSPPLSPDDVSKDTAQ
ncbi:Hypothetical protein D9617_6g092770 [Elsinoe fawcettii]|nr:Hypothetical protein D9617_6g092770 [Elsinoe fawcettii]